ncbi:MAG TPA: peroxide stress protein YaaA [Mycobacteriales bacterium]|nr:peroxide stress protein YaaA [Mycobacteriales bacterium]
MLLPPSEGKAGNGNGPPYDPGSGTFGSLAAARIAVRQALWHRDFDAAGQLGVQGVALVAARATNGALERCPTMPALRRYTGVLYDALDYRGAPAALRRRLDAQLIIVSGLLGLVRGGDPVPDYKLPIGARVPGLGRLGSFWKPHLAGALEPCTARRVVWDLLPVAHAAAAPVRRTRAHWRVRVLREQGGRRSTVSHDNKAVKGALARVLVAERIVHPKELAGWRGPGGYRVDAVLPDGTVELVSRG